MNEAFRVEAFRGEEDKRKMTNERKNKPQMKHRLICDIYYEFDD